MPINRSIGVNLAFTADTKQAQAQLNNLQHTLTQLVNTAPSQGFSGFTKELQQASTAAATLKVQLSEATNVNTGKLDLGKFNQSLKASGMTLEMYKTQLTNLGPQGVAAFGQLSQAIMNAEIPLRRSSQLLTNFATTLKNTARWQISSSLLHGFMGSVQTAYYYAQDLNESLNNIRIVTGKNTDEMTQFAKEANAAAQALSTTTTAYTDASLIYYQQGLDDDQVRERTDVTIKMANVARESATEVSEQLTAVWNNFAKGGENLEYYADVMTALGAATASSSAEIAEGLEKFAAVADTVGLSYEYATSALATVTATTRQSADVVGNAFKTLFARIQGLQLGDTLEDGTDLNKYSAALDAVGISIKDTNGDIKDMDTILDELGNKWKTLGKDQQMALAQTVAGVRQYTQLIALMDNWDFFEKNLATARESKGTLQEQANIYAESWEAAQKRVQAAAEQIYQDLLNDQFFIDINNALEKLLNLIDKLIKSIGGVQGVLSLAGMGLLKLYGSQLAEGINNTIYNLKMMSQTGQASLEQTKNKVNELLQSFYQDTNNSFDKAVGEAYKLQGQAQEELIKQANLLDESQKKIASTLLDQNKTLTDNVVKQAELAKQADAQSKNSQNIALLNTKSLSIDERESARKNMKIYAQEMTKAGRFNTVLENATGNIQEDLIDTENLSDASQEINKLQEGITRIINQFSDVSKKGSEVGKDLKKAFGEDAGSALQDLWSEISNIDWTNLDDIRSHFPGENDATIIRRVADAFLIVRDSANELSQEGQDARTALEGLDIDLEDVTNDAYAAGQASGGLDNAMQRASESANSFGDRLKNLVSSLQMTGDQVVKVAQSFASASMMAGTITTNITSLSNGTLTAGQAFSSMAMIVPQVTSAITKMSAVTGVMGKLLSGGFLLAFTAVITAIQLYIEHLKKAREEMIENSKVSVEVAEKLRKEADANEEVYNSYMELYEEYKQGIITKEDLYDATDNLTEAYELEGGAIAKLTGNYEDLAVAADNARKKQLEEAKAANERVLKERPTGGFAEGTEGRGHFINDRKTYVFNADIGPSFSNDDYLANKALIEKATKHEISYYAGAAAGGTQLQIDTTNTASFINYYKTLSETLEELADKGLTHTDTYKNISEELTQIEGAYNDIMAAQEGILGETLELSAKDNDIANATKENVGQIIDNMKKAIEEEIAAGNIDSDTDVDKAVTTYVASLNNEVANAFLQNKTLKDSGLSDEVLTKFNSFSKADQGLILTAGIQFDEHTTTTDLELVLDKAKTEVGSISIPIDMMSSLNESVLKGKDINKNDWESLLASIPEEAQSILGEREDFNNAGLAERFQLMQQINQVIIENSSEYLKNIEIKKQDIEIARQQCEQQLELLKIEREGLIAALGRRETAGEAAAEINKRLAEIDEEIDHYTNKERTLKIEVEPELSLDVFEDKLNAAAELTLNDINAIRSGVELIGEDWTVAADDVRQFAELFPQIAAEAEHAADGTLKLSKEQVATVLKGNMEIINSNKEVIVSGLDDKLAQLRAEQKFQAKKEEIIKQTLESERGAVDYEGQMHQALSDYKINLEAAGVRVDADAWNQAMQNASTGSNNIISSVDAINQAVMTVHDNIAHIFDEKYPMNSITATATAGNTGAESWSAGVDIDESWQAHQDELMALQNELENSQKRQKELADEIAATEGLRAEILKGVKDTSEAIERVNSGQAGKASSSKKSGGGGSKDKDKELKKLEDEFDRYWEIKKAIDGVERALSRLDKQQENLYGYELINSLKQENQLLDQQRANYEALAEAQRAEAAELQGLLSGYGVAFDASGAITNYAAAVSAALAEYNDAIAKFNAGLITASELTVYEKNYEEFKKALDRYDQLYYTEMQDTQEKLEDIWRQQLANNLKAWEVEVQLKLDMKQLRRDWNDFITEVQEDFQKVYQDLRLQVKNMAKDAKTYIGEDGTISTIINAVHDVTNEIDKLRAGEGSDMFESISQAQEKLKELNQQLLEAGRNLHDLWKEAWDAYLSGIDQVSDQFDDLIDRFEKINDELEFQKELIELLYGPEAYGLMDKYYKGQEKNTLEQLKSLKTQTDMWEQLWRESGATMDNQNEWTADQQKYYEQWQEAQKDLNDLTLEYIRLLKEDYANTVKGILKDLEKGLTGSSLKDLETEWDRISAHAEKYYDSVESAYETQKLANKINQSIADTTNIKAQEKLQALREKEIGYLRSKDELTKYDLEAAEARYQIALKEIALEDAQNNKTSMKLTRNEQGNWSYQYIADEENVATKRQELLDAYNQLYQLASDAYESNLESLQNLQQQYLDSAREIYENEALTEEEREQQLLELRQWYLDEYKLIAEENSLYRNDLATAGAALLLEIYEQDEEAYTAMTENERDLVDALVNANIDDYMDLEEKIKDNYQNIDDKAREVMEDTRQDWTSGAQQIADLWNADNGSSVRVQVINAYNKIIEASQRYQAAVDECAIVVGRDFSEEGITGAIMRAEQETDNLKDKTVDLVNSSVPYLNELRSYVDMIAAAWQGVQQEIMNAISLIDEYLRYVGEANAAAAEGVSSSPYGGGGDASGSGNGGDEGGSPGSPSNPSSGSQIVRRWSDGTWTVGQEGHGQIIESRDPGNASDYTKQRGWKDWMHYATGGYTGEWANGSEDGRLAVLHQKELVLNEKDTGNFLSAIKTLRDMTSLNNSITGVIADSIANMIMGLSKHSFGNVPSSTNNNSNTSNTFNITAEFPNANNVNEIKQAILSLPNLASQYIATNNK